MALIRGYGIILTAEIKIIKLSITWKGYTWQWQCITCTGWQKEAKHTCLAFRVCLLVGGNTCLEIGSIL